MASSNSAVVASLRERSTHPLSSISLSPSRQFAVIAGKETLQIVKISPEGIHILRSLKISQHFQTNVAERRSQPGKYGDVRDTFGLGVPKQSAQSSMTHGNVAVTCVAWSPIQSPSGGNDGGDPFSTPHQLESEKTNTMVAAAGSNGVVVVWSSETFFPEGRRGSSTLGNQQPQGYLSQHTRAVNSLAWHPRRPGLLLTASQDATVKLWERREMTQRGDEDKRKKRSWFANKAGSRDSKSYQWFCNSTFEPKSEAVRDIQWSNFRDDIFALVTVSGSLVVYSRHVAMKSIVKIAAHTGDSTCLDFHPTRPYIIATGGSTDRCVKVWDLESSVSMNKKEDIMISTNSSTWNTARSEASTNSSSSEIERSGPSSGGISGVFSSNTNSISGIRSFTGSAQNSLSTPRHKSSSSKILHVLSVSAAVTHVKWRPPASNANEDDDEDQVDWHDSMLAVASARLTSAGGSGVLGLWSCHRPFMPLSVVEGHKEGAIGDFVWLETPQEEQQTRSQAATNDAPESNAKPRMSRRASLSGNPNDETVVIRGSARGETESILFDNKDSEKDDKKRASPRIWQHALSVGRDGRCLLQAFTRGDQPISRIPPSCFAMANLSPFQSGYGSLQLFSVYQNVPKGIENNVKLTGLRQDTETAEAPGVFKEGVVESSEDGRNEIDDFWAPGRRLPDTSPELVFNIVDQGDLGTNRLPIDKGDGTICVAPEVIHLSRFASSYKLYPDSKLPTRVDLCLHNAEVAENLRCGPLAWMWRTVASILSGSGLDELPHKGALASPANAMQFALLPTIKLLLIERAEAGDVQTCVALCEVLQVIQSDEQTRVPGLELNLVREWYLSYIDLLQQMCLFSAASFLIRSCKDPFIGALNKNSTTIHESCPRCGKPMQPSTETTADSGLRTTARMACKNCRRRVGQCFLCHEPVKGMFVWCPGCGHGGHLEHALQWFGGSGNEKPVREVCPTGCGHRCNFTQSLSGFPRTDSLMCLPVGEPSTDSTPR